MSDREDLASGEFSAALLDADGVARGAAEGVGTDALGLVGRFLHDLGAAPPEALRPARRRHVAPESTMASSAAPAPPGIALSDAGLPAQEVLRRATPSLTAARHVGPTTVVRYREPV